MLLLCIINKYLCNPLYLNEKPFLNAPPTSLEWEPYLNRPVYAPPTVLDWKNPFLNLPGHVSSF